MFGNTENKTQSNNDTEGMKKLEIQRDPAEVALELVRKIFPKRELEEAIIRALNANKDLDAKKEIARIIADTLEINLVDNLKEGEFEFSSQDSLDSAEEGLRRMILNPAINFPFEVSKDETVYDVNEKEKGKIIEVFRKFAQARVEKEEAVKVDAEAEQSKVEEKKEEEKEGKSKLPGKIKLLEKTFEKWKKTVEACEKEEELKANSYYLDQVCLISKHGLSEEEKKELNLQIEKFKVELEKIVQNKRLKIKYGVDNLFDYRTQVLLANAIGATKERMEKLIPGNDKLESLKYYQLNVIKVDRDGLSEDELKALDFQIKEALKEIEKVWQLKKREFEIYETDEKIKKIVDDFERAIENVDEMDAEEFRDKYDLQGIGKKFQDGDIRDDIRKYLNDYLHHIAEPIDSSKKPDNWDQEWKKISKRVQTINDNKGKYDLLVVDGETYVADVSSEEVNSGPLEEVDQTNKETVVKEEDINKEIFERNLKIAVELAIEHKKELLDDFQSDEEFLKMEKKYRDNFIEGLIVIYLKEVIVQENLTFVSDDEREIFIQRIVKEVDLAE